MSAITSLILKSVSSKEEALLVLSKSDEWVRVVNRVVNDIRHWWMAEPLAVESKYINYVLVRAYLKSGPVSVKIPLSIIDGFSDKMDYNATVHLIFRYYFLQRHIEKSDLWNSLMLCSLHFTEWGLDSPRQAVVRKKSRSQRRISIFDFSDFWVPTFINAIVELTGSTIFEMVNSVIKEARFAVQSPVKHALTSSQGISRLKIDAHKLASGFHSHGVEVDEAINIIKSYYVNKVMNQ